MVGKYDIYQYYYLIIITIEMINLIINSYLFFDDCRMVIDNTVHLCHTHLTFGTCGSLTLDISISP